MASIEFRGELAISLLFLLCFSWTTASSETSLLCNLGPLEEEKRSGTVVGNVAKETNISQKVSQSEFSTIKYKFLTSPNNHNAALFEIDSNMGTIKTQTKIDRESICEDMEVCLVELDAVVESEVTGYFKLVPVKINITDINDNQPFFKNEEIFIDVAENNFAGMTKSLPRAVDPDTDVNSVKTYLLRSQNYPFKLDVSRRLNNRLSVNLVVTRQLDREMRDRYTVLLMAVDGGVQPLTGTLTVHINVTDVNDNSPIFTQQDYSFSVAETASIGDVLGKVTATDADVGRNKDIRYTIIFPTRDHRGPQLFGIDQYTGEITIKTRLQYDAGKTFQAIVEARDQGVVQNLAEATLTLTVVNVGNNAPRMELTLSGTVRTDTAPISEDAKNNTFIGKLDAIDNDPGASGIVDCWSRHRNFKVVNYGDYFTIVLNGSLDREEAENIDVTLVCRDKGSPPQQASITFYVIVTDANDNPPVFTRKVYEVNITEGNIIGKRILKVEATDRDNGINKVIKYSLYPKENSVFSISRDTGWLVARDRFDHEVEKTVNVIVVAEDSGVIPLTGTATVIVTIKDINDNYPELTVRSLSVPEGGPKMKKVGQLMGKDRDSGRNGKLTFSMPLQNSDFNSQFFRVEADGTVLAIQPLDRETRDRYHLNIEVRDSGNPPKIKAATVTIIVEDINDNAPEFHFPTPRNKSVGVKWSFPPKRAIVRVNATDPDLGNNKKVTYYIHSGNRAGLFGLDKDHGILFLNRKIKASDDQVHRLVIAAHDLGENHLESKNELEVVIDVTNATFAALEGNRVEDKYILIAGIVAGITLLLSIIILVIIFVIRNGNRRRPLPPMAAKAQNWHVVKTGVQEECGKGQVLESVGVAWRGSDEDIDKKSSGSGGGGGGGGRGGGGGERNGEGGFSRGSQPDVTKTGNEVTFKKALVSNNTWSDGRDGYIQNHGNVGIGLDPYRKQEFYTFCKVRNSHDDVHSVTSGDTNNSDSGRGGSEDDIPLPPIAECSPELNSIHGSPKHVTEYRPITTMPSNSMLRHPNNKSEYKTLPSLTSFKGPDSNMYPSPHSLRSETSMNSTNTLPYSSDRYNHPSSSRHNSQGYTSLAQVSSKPTGGTGRHVTFSNRKGGGGGGALGGGGPTSEIILSDPSARRSPVLPPSYDSLEKDLNSLYVSLPRSVDDDDGNTTTSGSYTIDSDNLNESIISA